MNLYRKEIIFAGDFLKELRNKRVERFPFQTEQYQQALKQTREKFESKGRIPKPLNTLLIPAPITGNFSRINTAIQHYMGTEISILTPHFNEFIIFDAYPSEVKDPLAKKFANIFIEELNL